MVCEVDGKAAELFELNSDANIDEVLFGVGESMVLKGGHAVKWKEECFVQVGVESEVFSVPEHSSFEPDKVVFLLDFLKVGSYVQLIIHVEPKVLIGVDSGDAEDVSDCRYGVPEGENSAFAIVDAHIVVWPQSRMA